jgi:hypothetical protein
MKPITSHNTAMSIQLARLLVIGLRIQPGQILLARRRHRVFTGNHIPRPLPAVR